MTRSTARPLRLTLVIAAALTLSACAEVPDLMQFRDRTSSPNEFAVVPNRELETPPNTAVLPVPTTGGVNRTVQTPVEDAVVALGGTAAALNRQGIPATDGALLAAAGRFGTETGIRDRLAAEDLAYRRANRARPAEVVAGLNVYFRAYRPMQLNQHAETARLRAAGVDVPGAPPPQPAEQ